MKKLFFSHNLAILLILVFILPPPQSSLLLFRHCEKRNSSYLSLRAERSNLIFSSTSLRVSNAGQEKSKVRGALENVLNPTGGLEETPMPDLVIPGAGIPATQNEEWLRSATRSVQRTHGLGSAALLVLMHFVRGTVDLDTAARRLRDTSEWEIYDLNRARAILITTWLAVKYELKMISQGVEAISDYLFDPTDSNRWLALDKIVADGEQPLFREKALRILKEADFLNSQSTGLTGPTDEAIEELIEILWAETDSVRRIWTENRLREWLITPPEQPPSLPPPAGLRDENRIWAGAVSDEIEWMTKQSVSSRTLSRMLGKIQAADQDLILGRPEIISVLNDRVGALSEASERLGRLINGVLVAKLTDITILKQTRDAEANANKEFSRETGQANSLLKISLERFERFERSGDPPLRQPPFIGINRQTGLEETPPQGENRRPEFPIKPEEVLLYHKRAGESTDRKVSNSIWNHLPPDFREATLLTTLESGSEGLVFLTRNSILAKAGDGFHLDSVPVTYEMNVSRLPNDFEMNRIRGGTWVRPRGRRGNGNGNGSIFFKPANVESIPGESPGGRMRITFPQGSRQLARAMLEKRGVDAVAPTRATFGSIELNGMPAGGHRRARWKELLALTDLYGIETLSAGRRTPQQESAIQEETVDQELILGLLENKHYLRNVFESIFSRPDLIVRKVEGQDIVHIWEGGFKRVYRVALSLQGEPALVSFYVKIVKPDVVRSDSGYLYDVSYVNRIMEIADQARQKFLFLYPPSAPNQFLSDRLGRSRIVFSEGAIFPTNAQLASSEARRLAIETYMKLYLVSDGKIFLEDPKPANTVLHRLSRRRYEGTLVDLDNLLEIGQGSYSSSVVVFQLLEYGFRTDEIVPAMENVLGTPKTLELLNAASWIDKSFGIRRSDFQDRYPDSRQRLQQSIADGQTRSPLLIPASMRITLNGKEQIIPEGATLADLLSDRYVTIQSIAVRINGLPLPEEAGHPLSLSKRWALYDQTSVREGGNITWAPAEKPVLEPEQKPGEERIHVKHRRVKIQDLKQTGFDRELKKLRDDLARFRRDLTGRYVAENEYFRAAHHALGRLIPVMDRYLKQPLIYPLNRRRIEDAVRAFDRVDFKDEDERRQKRRQLMELINTGSTLDDRFREAMNSDAAPAAGLEENGEDAPGVPIFQGAHFTALEWIPLLSGYLAQAAREKNIPLRVRLSGPEGQAEVLFSPSGVMADDLEEDRPADWNQDAASAFHRIGVDTENGQQRWTATLDEMGGTLSFRFAPHEAGRSSSTDMMISVFDDRDAGGSDEAENRASDEWGLFSWEDGREPNWLAGEGGASWEAAELLHRGSLRELAAWLNRQSVADWKESKGISRIEIVFPENPLKISRKIHKLDGPNDIDIHWIAERILKEIGPIAGFDALYEAVWVKARVEIRPAPPSSESTGLEENGDESRREFLKSTLLASSAIQFFIGLFQDGNPKQVVNDPELGARLNVDKGRKVTLVANVDSAFVQRPNRILAQEGALIPRQWQGIPVEVLPRNIEEAGVKLEAIDADAADVALLNYSVVGSEDMTGWDELLRSREIAGLVLSDDILNSVNTLLPSELAALLGAVRMAGGLMVPVGVQVYIRSAEEKQLLLAA